MALVRRLVELGRSARAAAVVRVRQPLARALVGAPGFAALPAELRAQVADELNVRELDPLAAVAEDLVDYTVRPNFRALGRRFGKGTPRWRGGDRGGRRRPGWPRSCGRRARPRSWSDGAPVSLGPDDVIVTQTPRSGWAVAPRRGETVALEITITPELRREGLAREVIRLVQDARKGDGLEVSDRISLRWSTADPDLAGRADRARGDDQRRGAGCRLRRRGPSGGADPDGAASTSTPIWAWCSGSAAQGQPGRGLLGRPSRATRRPRGVPSPAGRPCTARSRLPRRPAWSSSPGPRRRGSGSGCSPAR